ncbi:MAG: KR domain-containing protein [Hyphomicrobiales bacterium]|nr:KR domain-containing protein [Hyphomicrobiales bacterium]
MGARGQPLYAASNSALDALLEHRRSLGLCATSIQWGLFRLGIGVETSIDLPDTMLLESSVVSRILPKLLNSASIISEIFIAPSKTLESLAEYLPMKMRGLPMRSKAPNNTGWDHVSDISVHTNDAVLAIYQKELQSEGMGMASDFFESGGDSLKAVRIVASLRALHKEHPELQIGKGISALSATDILQHHTPGALLKSCFGCSSTIRPLTQGMPIMPRPTEMRLRATASFQQAIMYTGEHLVRSQAHSDYNVLIQFGAIGKLDVEAMKMALAFLWRRHQVLRTALILQVPQFPGFIYI